MSKPSKFNLLIFKILIKLNLEGFEAIACVVCEDTNNGLFRKKFSKF